MSARVILTAAPTAATVARSRALLAFAALTAAGHQSIAHGAYEPAAVSRRAEAMVSGWVYDVRYAQPMPERTARMVAAALDLAGIACRVEVVS